MIAQMRKKYDHKLQEAEAAFLRKKKELDVNQNKVLMNKLLADAFRCKCMNLKPSGFSGMRQGMQLMLVMHFQRVVNFSCHNFERIVASRFYLEYIFNFLIGVSHYIYHQGDRKMVLIFATLLGYTIQASNFSSKKIFSCVLKYYCSL